jgi:hypothetical protein
VLLATVSLALIGASGHTLMVKERHDLLRASSILEADSAPAAAVPTNRGPRVPPNWEAGVKPSGDTQTVPGENNPWANRGPPHAKARFRCRTAAVKG